MNGIAPNLSIPVNSFGFNIPQGPITIGGFSGASQFDGSVDDVRIYNRALSDTEVAALYAYEAPQPPLITVQPEGRTVGLGETVSFGVTATGSAPLSFQWSKDGNVLPGATNATLTLTNVQPPRIGDYRVVVSNGVGSVTSSVAALNIQGVDAGIWKGLIAYYPFNGNSSDESINKRSAILVGGVLPVDDRFGVPKSAVHLDGVTGFVDIRGSRFPEITASKPRTFSVWVKLDAPRSGSFFLQYGMDGYPLTSSPGSTFGMYFNNHNPLVSRFGLWCNSKEILFEGGVDRYMHHIVSYDGFQIRFYLDGVLLGSLDAELNTADDKIVLGLNLENSQPSFRGVIDDVRIYNRALSDAEVAALYASEAPQPPLITVQPEGRTVGLGETVSFGVTATGSAPLSFQWTKDGNALPGATNATLTLTNVQPPRIGDYRVVVSIGAGSVTSDLAALNIRGVDAGIWKGLVAYYKFHGDFIDSSPFDNNGEFVSDGGALGFPLDPILGEKCGGVKVFL